MMATGIPLIGGPNYVAIAGMQPQDLLTTREYFITCLVKARRANDSDTLNAAIDWIVALTSEMRLRGGSARAPDTPMVSL